jgi:hypothetical protein
MIFNYNSIKFKSRNITGTIKWGIFSYCSITTNRFDTRLTSFSCTVFPGCYSFSISQSRNRKTISTSNNK